MVKRTIEVCECDVCGKDAQRYTIGFPDGVLALDRCEGGKLDALRNGTGFVDEFCRGPYRLQGQFSGRDQAADANQPATEIAASPDRRGSHWPPDHSTLRAMTRGAAFCRD